MIDVRDVWTIERLCDYIVDNADRIPVREQLDGKWGSYFLTELPPKLALKHALQFVKKLRIPTSITEPNDTPSPPKLHRQVKYDKE